MPKDSFHNSQGSKESCTDHNFLHFIYIPMLHFFRSLGFWFLQISGKHQQRQYLVHAFTCVPCFSTCICSGCLGVNEELVARDRAKTTDYLLLWNSVFKTGHSISDTTSTNLHIFYFIRTVKGINQWKWHYLK